MISPQPAAPSTLPSTSNAQQGNMISPQPAAASSPPTTEICYQLVGSTATNVISSQPSSVVSSQPPGVVHSQPNTNLSSKQFKVFSSQATIEAADKSLGLVSLQPADFEAQPPADIPFPQSFNSISHSTSVSPQQHPTALLQPTEKFNIGVENNIVVQPQEPFHGTPYSAVSTAVNTILDMDYYDGGNEAMMSDIDSGLSPNSSSHSVFNTTPPNVEVNRSLSRPGLCILECVMGRHHTGILHQIM